MGTKRALNKITDIENQIISEGIKRKVSPNVPKEILDRKSVV